MAQWLMALGPGPTEEIEYSPTVVFTPPRVMGLDHSLTDINHVDFGNVSITSAAHASFQPQSQTITLALGLPR